MTREELIAYDRWLTENKWGSSDIITPEQAADLYLAKHPLPPAEGAVNFDDIYELLGRGIDKIMRCESSLGALADEAEAFINSEVKKRLEQPTAEGAEEILKKHMNGRAVQEYKEELFIEYNTVVAAMQEFATLHAQRIADKMVDAKTSRNGC